MESNSPTTDLINVEISHGKTLNLAMVHNAVPLVKVVRITNCSAVVLQDLLVRLEIRPALSEPWEIRIASIGPGYTYNIEEVDLSLKLDRVANTTEREKAELWAEVSSHGEIIYSRPYQLDLLAYNEWNGRFSLPQLLAAFVQPNHPALSQALVRTRTILERRTGDSALSGYQARDPMRVRAMTAALYEALQSLDLTYINPPASFEETGQKIRTPEQIFKDGMGTCLDLSVLLAACLEQIGLRPWIVLVRGHAFPGVWLSEQNLPFSCTDDSLQLLKTVELDGACFFDASTMAMKPRETFDRAERAACSYLRDSEHFRFAIDIHAARIERILPLPSRVEKEAYVLAPVVSLTPSSREEPLHKTGPGRPSGPASPQAKGPTTRIARLNRWKERLLDLSLRNRLLNFRESKKTIPMICPDLASLEDALAMGEGFQILAKPDILSENDPRSPKLLDARTGEDTMKAFLLEQLKNHCLHSPYTAQELERRQLQISREALISLEESGVNSLFLALGFLAWYESPSSEQARFAPLILVPVELTRASARHSFKLQRIDDETRVNVTLLEKLRKEHGIEIPELADEIPQDDAGVDVPLILRLFREAIFPIGRWRVEEQAFIGHFLFSKFLMWHDLETGADALMANDVVRHLACGAEDPFPDQGPFLQPERLDAESRPGNTFCPLDGDSTQIAAVLSAEQGRTFVLEGPPGTGKSQTIANLISQCLAVGKTVLFVSEKMAALDVVHRRLESVGLGEFCLEMHSNKARGKEVLEKLKRSWDAIEAKAPAEWAARAAELELVRNKLNGYAIALHAPRGLGLSVFQGLTKLTSLRNSTRLPLNLSQAPHFVEHEQFNTYKEAVARVQAAAMPLGDLVHHPWRAVGQGEWKFSGHQETMAEVNSLGETVADVERWLPLCVKALQADEPPTSQKELAVQRTLAQLLLDSPCPPPEMLEVSGWSTTKAEVASLIEHGRRRDELEHGLAGRYNLGQLLRLDIGALQGKFMRWAMAFFLLAFFVLFFTRRAMRKVLQPGQRLPANGEVAQDLGLAIELGKENEYLSKLECCARFRLGPRPGSGEGSSWDQLEALVLWVEKFRKALSLTQKDDNPGKFKRILSLAGKDSPLQGEGTAGRRALKEYIKAHDACVGRQNHLSSQLKLDEGLAWGDPDAPAFLDRLRERVQAWQRGESNLRDWSHYVRMRDEAAKEGLAPLLKAHFEGSCATESLMAIFERSFYEDWLEGVIEGDQALRGFHSSEHTRLIHKFRELDMLMRDMTQKIIPARLAAQLPDPQSGAVASSELGILLREIQKKRRHLPIRKLFARIPALLRRLKPCLLMSPLSVAQYLGTDYAPFDLVVFDEASQIPTHDAIGAIGRGRQLVVVGDTKQLPPTNFFARMGENDEIPDESEIEELESILDECQAARLPRLRLGWHYRSRHESLITFSNYHYYGNVLHTFPSATSARDQLGVSWRHISEGHYDKGKSRTNQGEAEAVVGEVVRRLLDPELHNRSIGIVTFSMAQQRLIEDLLDEKRRQYPEIERFFGAEMKDPVFIKNLENVQGDERDVMLFSVCYGPDRNGNVSMNFGPLNRGGGERRLNVAITRARYQLIVFSTLVPDQINLSRTQSVGVQHLKTFLDYAARGPQAIAEAAVPGKAGDFDSPFEAEVCKALTNRGWEVHPQVGCSGYRIDLGVVHPDYPGHYLLGIECDGANYHSAKCARDRDRLRELVLRGLGWRLHRVWSTDWWHDPRREAERIENTLEQAKTEFRRASSGGAWSEKAEHMRPKPPPLSTRAQLRPATMDQPLLFAKTTTAKASSVLAENPGIPYPEVAAPRLLGQPDFFYMDQADGIILRELSTIIKREAPIHLQVATRRLLECFNLKRATQKTISRVRALVGRTGAKVIGDFIWASNQDPMTYDLFRRAGGGVDQQRKAHEIPSDEAANAALVILRQNISLSTEDLARETARLLGFAHVGQKVLAQMAECIEVLVARGVCKVENGRVELL